jgi:hypothetical protein
MVLVLLPPYEPVKEIWDDLEQVGSARYKKTSRIEERAGRKSRTKDCGKIEEI